MDLASELPGNTKEVTLSREQKQILPLCSAPLRSRLDHCTHREDREHIQRRDNKLVGGMEHLCREGRAERVGIVQPGVKKLHGSPIVAFQ